MLIAKVNGNTVLEVADYRELFPDTSFPTNGPNDDFFIAAYAQSGMTIK